MEVTLLGQQEDPFSTFYRRNLPESLFTHVSGGSPLYIAGKRCRIPPLPAESTLLADAENPFLPLESPGVRVLTCGLSPKDTFTFSSRGEENGVVSLMRAVSLSGDVAEPMEIPISFPAGTDDFHLLSVTAALLLTGQLEKRMADGKLLLYK